MDPVSQAVFGVLGSGLKKSSKKDILICSLWGALGGMAPDIDYFIRSSNDPLLTIEYHRQVTHSLFFIPFGALIVSILLKIFKIPIKKSYFYVLLGYATHGLLDSCTNYGTQLWWPFSDKREAWNLLAVIDPLVTLPLIVLVILFFKKKKYLYVHVAWVYFLLYVGIQGFKKSRIEDFLHSSNIIDSKTERFMIKPTIFNNFLWRVIVVDKQNSIHFHAVNHSFFGSLKLYRGDSAKLVLSDDAKVLFPRFKNARDDFERFKYFTDGFIHWTGDYRISDSRYSLLPTSSSPLWEISFENTDREHVGYKVFRKPTKEQREVLIKMLKAETLQ